MNELNPTRKEITLQALNLLGLKHKNDSEIMISCPFHKDNTPSMGIDIDNGRVHCFSCGYSGSIETLFRDLTGENLKQLLGISSDKFTSYASNTQFKTFNFTPSQKAKTVYVRYNPEDFQDIQNNPLCLDYLANRGISLSVAKGMNMQYVEDTRINTTRFRRRLIIPVYENNKLISFEGRRVVSTDPDPKVLYPKNTSVNTLYDIDNLDMSQPLYACEGLMDLAVLRSDPTFKNSTSIFGANITKRQIELIKKFKSFIYIYDLDAAGYKTLETLQKADLSNLYTLKLPERVNDIKIKDVGDLPKTGITVTDLVNRKWLNYIKKTN